MPFSRRRLSIALVSTSLLAALAAALPAAASPTSSDDARSKPRVVSGEAAAARDSLSEARALFDGTGTRPGRDATMVLRDLVLARDSLTGAERREADRILARPTDGLAQDPDGYQAGVPVKTSCADVCVHWVESSADAVSTVDANGNSRPDYVDAVIATMDHVHDTFIGAGYRAPKPDGTLGGSSLPDVYLGNIGDDDLYGYCASDDPTVPDQGPFDAWAYCVLDNDYSSAEFPTNTPLENMQVTAAHEYFHAVQFGYDLLEDDWFAEATATWMEDEMYDDVDDNLNYFSTGPLAFPSRSLDTFNGGGYQYGAWIFFRYLSERFPAEEGGLPTLVRDMWRKADGSASGPDQYSMQAVSTVLKERGTTLAAAFAGFADGNRRPGSTYEEGLANGYPAAPAGTFVMKNGWATTTLDHLTSATGRFVSQKGFSKLKVVIDMPPKKAGSAAVVTVIATGGGTQTTTFPLNKKGNGAKTFPFKPATVKSVEVTLVNASAKYSCWQQNGPFSCHGFATFDDLTGKIRGLGIR